MRIGRTGWWTLGVVATVGIGGVIAAVICPKPTVGALLDELGFVELRPPSTLFMPGTVVVVVGDDPLRLRTICTPSEAFGLESGEGVQWSDSADVDMGGFVDSRFRVGEAGLRRLNASGAMESVSGVSVMLRNVKVAEMPDTTAVRGIVERSMDCRQAIADRVEAGQEVSVVRAVFVADAEYALAFRAGVDAEGEAKARESVGMALNAVVRGGSDRRVVGEQLAWGLQEDSRLVDLGRGLPATGRSQHDRKPILRERGPIAEVERTGLRQSATGSEVSAVVDVSPMMQWTSMGCWATVYAMMKSWCDDREWSVSDAVAQLGKQYVTYLVEDSGLPGGSEAVFVQDAGMVAEPPANYMLWSYADMIRRYGPLWVTMGDGLTSHAVVLVGVYGDSFDNTLEAYEESTFEFIDPEVGAYSRVSGLDFARKFEGEAAVRVGVDATTNLRWQIIHWGEGQCNRA